MSLAATRTPVPSSLDTLLGDLVTSTARTAPVPSPATGERLFNLPRSSADDVRGAVSRARLAQVAWARLGFAARRRVLLRAHDLILDRREQLLDLTQLESGKTRGQAFEEVFQAASVTRWNALMARRVLGGGRRRAGIPLVLSARVRYRPKGVVGVITPWNYAVSLAAMDVVPALAAGCAVVQKADDQGALSVLALRRAFVDAGLPEALWAVVAGDPAEAGEALTDEVDYICFTGSTATGRRIAEKAGRRLVGASLELGGKNALIVLDDVDVEQAAADAAHA
ncbi:MAG TPA: aldehyde dehydrogenase family protein, partial [Agromyces sp.]